MNEAVVRRREGEGTVLPCFGSYLEVADGDDVARLSFDAFEGAGDDAHGDAVVARHDALSAAKVLIAGLHHLLAGGHVQPQLQRVHGRLFVRKLGVDDAAACSHPLDVTAAEDAAVASVVCMP